MDTLICPSAFTATPSQMLLDVLTRGVKQIRQGRPLLENLVRLLFADEPLSEHAKIIDNV